MLGAEVQGSCMHFSGQLVVKGFRAATTPSSPKGPQRVPKGSAKGP